ncbi:MAG: VCBS repeat-containing protein, partial [Deltaproteobacteria bacterium]
LMGPTTIYISEVLDYQSNNFEPLDKTPLRALRVNIAPKHYAVIVGVPSGSDNDNIIVPSNSVFSVMVYGSVLINGEISPDLGFGAESLGLYDFRLRHEVAYLTINGVTGSGMVEPDPGYEFNSPMGSLSNTDDGDGYATSSFNDFNQGTTFTTPTGINIPLAVVNFSTGTVDGPTTIYISEVLDYQSNNFEYLDRIPRRSLRVNVITDTTPPLVFINSPISGQVFDTTTVVVTGTATDSGGIGIDWVKVNGITATGTDTWTVTLTGLSPGVNTFTAIVRDNFGNSGQSAPVNITVDLLPPSITITSPSDGSYLNTTEVIVTGTASDPAPSSGYQIIVNGYIASMDGINWIANVTLPGEGPHTITAQAIDLAGNTDTHTIGVILDLTAPLVAINSPTPGSLFLQNEVVVTGSASDLSSGIDRVAVNGVSAEVSAGSWVATLTGLADGPLTLQARAWDIAGNSSLSAPVVITIDTTPPQVFIGSPTNGQAFNTTTITVSGTAADQGSGIDWVKVNGFTATGTETWTAIVTGLTQGVNILTATVEDIAGYSGISAPVSITIDSVPPLVAVTSPVNGTTVPGPGVTVRGTVSDATIGVSSVVVNGETATINYPAGTFMVILPDQLPGPLTIIATATDLLGNKADSSPVIVNVEFDLLSVFITSPLNGTLVDTSNLTVEGIFSALDPGDVVITVNSVTASTITTGTTTGSFTATLTILVDGPYTITAIVDDGAETKSDTIWITVDTTKPLVSITSPTHLTSLNSPDVVVTGTVTDATSDILWVTVNGITADLDTGIYTATLIGQPDGPLTITATARDEAGNTEVTEVLITIDTTDPLLSITTPSSGENINTTQLLVTGTVTDPAPSSSIDLIIVNGQTAAYDPGPGTWSATLSLSEGPQTITAQAWDQAGNPSPPDSVNITIDSLIPAIVIESPTDGSYLNTTNVVVTGTVTDPAPSSGISLITVNGQAAAYNPGSGTWSATLSLSEGPQTITAQAWDTANNLDIDSINITIDINDPLVAITSPTDGALINTDTVVVLGTATDPGSGISQVTVNGQSTDYNPGSSTWSITLTGLTEGPLTLIANAVDNYGRSTDSAPVTITIDYTSPLISITSPGEGEIITTNWLMVTGTASDPGSGISQVIVNGQSADYNPGPGTWSITLTGLADGNLEITATATDNAGNYADCLPVDVTIDYTPPLVVITSPIDGTTVGGPTVPVNGTVIDAVTGVKQVIVNGVTANINPVAHTFVALLPGQANNSPLTIIATATDNADNQADSAPVRVMVKYTELTVTITEPLNGAMLNTANVDVNGVFTPTNVDLITVNGRTATILPGSNFEITLFGQPEGPLTITAVVTKSPQDPVQHTIIITLDFTPPFIAITSPSAGALLGPDDDTNLLLDDVQITVTVSTDAEDGQLAILTVNGLSSLIAVTGGIGIFSDITLAEGPNTLIAEIEDQAGNPASPDQIVIFLDTVAPTVSITFPTSGSVACTSTVIVSGTVSDPVPASGINKVIVNPGGIEANVTGESWTTTLFLLPEGNITIDANAQDNSDNSTVSSPVNITVDYTPPTVVITSPSPGDFLNTSTVTLQGTAEDDPGCGVALVLVNGQTANGTYTWSLTYFGEPQGPNTYSVKAVDYCGYETDPPVSVNITVDHTAPSVTITAPTSGAYFCTSTVIVSGTASDLISSISMVKVNGITAAGGESWTVTLTGLANGSNTIIATAYDKANNSAFSPPVNITTDTLPPVVSILSPTDGGYVNSTTVTVSGTATDDIGSGVAVVLVNGETATGTENWSITFTGQTGTPSYSSVAVDYCGQQSSPQVVSITIDLDLPMVELVSPVDGSCWTSSAVDISAICEDVGGQIASCQVQIDGGLWQDVPDTVSGLSDGPHTAVARAVDRGGNEVFSAPHNFNVDTTAPVVSIISPSPGSWSGGTVVITGTVSDAVEVGNSATLCLVPQGGDCVIFTLAAPTATPTYSESGSLDADFGDMDRDGDLDIVVANHNGQNRLYLNDGTGVFTDGTTRMPPDSDLSYDVELADVNGDLSLDIFVSNYGQNRLYLNNGSGIFTDGTSARLPIDSDLSRDAEFGDVDKDGYLDIVIANYNGLNRIYLNDGLGYFTEATGILPEDVDGSFDIELGDVDKDKDWDIFVSNWGEQNRLYLNNGSGIFSDGTEHLPEDADYSRDAELVDVAGMSSYPDLVIANYFGQNSFYYNDGNWSGTGGGGGGEIKKEIIHSFIDYTTFILPPLVDNSVDVALADIDSDGDQDIVVANYNQQNRFYLNNGRGGFSDITDPHLPVDMNSSRDMDFGDVDGDGDLDIIVANYYEQNLIYINNYGTVIQTVTVESVTGGGVFTGTYTNVAQGNYTATVISWDNCGNSASDSVNFNVDATLPLVTITSPSDGAYLNTTTIVVSGTATDTDSGLAAVFVNGQTASGTDIWSITFTNQYGEPFEISSRDTSGYSYGVYVTGGYAYMADDTGLAIIDVSDPTNPGAPVYRNTSGHSYGVYVTGNYAYVADWRSGLAIIDVTDPANPGTPVYRDTSGQSNGVYVTGNYAYVADCSSGLAIIDVSDPINPGTPVYRDTSGCSLGVYVVGNYAYMADDNSGLAIIDVTDPANPGTPVYRDTSGYSWGVYVTGNYAYIADESGLAIIDVSDPANPGTPVYRDTSGYSWGVYVAGNYAYVADDDSGLAIIDVSDPANPGTPVYRNTPGYSWGVYVTGGYAYVADEEYGLRVINVSIFNFPFLIFNAIAMDNGGNLSIPDTVNVLIDTVAPTISIATPTNDECFNSPTVLVSGSVDDPESSSGIAGVTVNGEVATVSDGNWVATLTGQPEGPIALIATAMDNAGNSTDSNPVNILFDYTSPVVSVTFPISGDCINSNMVVVTGTITEGGSGVAEINATWGAYSATSAGFPVYLDVSGVGEQTNDLVVSAVDFCGNIGPVDTVTNVQVDTV